MFSKILTVAWLCVLLSRSRQVAAEAGGGLSYGADARVKTVAWSVCDDDGDGAAAAAAGHVMGPADVLLSVGRLVCRTRPGPLRSARPCVPRCFAEEIKLLTMSKSRPCAGSVCNYSLPFLLFLPLPFLLSLPLSLPLSLSLPLFYIDFSTRGDGDALYLGLTY